MLELDSGGDYRVVDNSVAKNFTRSRAPEDGCPFEVVAQISYELTCL
jgi:hypothetical protein